MFGFLESSLTGSARLFSFYLLILGEFSQIFRTFYYYFVLLFGFILTVLKSAMLQFRQNYTNRGVNVNGETYRV